MDLIQIIKENIVNSLIGIAILILFKPLWHYINKLRYKYNLSKKFSDEVFDIENGLTLKELYIEPTISVYNIEKDMFEPTSYLLSDYIYEKINEYQTGKTIFVFGYPGQGKSMFCKHIAYELASFLCNITVDRHLVKKDVYLVQLKDLHINDLMSNPIKTINDYLKDKYNLLEINSKKSILILDGLDELFLKSGITNPTKLEELCIELMKTDDIFKIVTARHNYIDLKKIYKKQSEIIKINEFDDLKIRDYLINIGTKNALNTLKQIFELNQNRKNNEYILDMIKQPIILYMIVASGINIDENLTRVKLFEAVLENLIQRKWEQSKHIQFQEINKSDIEPILEDIAFRIYQSDREYILKEEILYLDSLKKFNNKVQSSEDFKKLLNGLLISFYFSKYDINEKNVAVEFFHKTFMEYFTARKIWSEVKKMDTLSQEDRFIKLQILFKKRISNEVVQNLKDVIEQDKEKIEFNNIFLKPDIQFVLDKSFQSTDSGLNIFYAYFTILKFHNKTHNFLYKSDRLKRKFLKIYEHDYLKNNFSLTNLSYLYLRNLKINGNKQVWMTPKLLTNLDISFSDLSYSTFSNIVIYSLKFNSTLFENSIFENINIIKILYKPAMTKWVPCEGLNKEEKLCLEDKDILCLKEYPPVYSKLEYTQAKFIKCSFTSIHSDDLNFQKIIDGKMKEII